MFVQVIEAWGLQGLAFRYKAKTWVNLPNYCNPTGCFTYRSSYI